ncbi:MAG: hypothetical protein ACM3ZV_02465 [Bacillota bacterium]
MATAAAAIAARARREVEDLFFEKDAFSPERAIAFEPRTPIQQRYLEQLIAEGCVHETEPGRYWFDLGAYRELRRQRFAWSLRILALGLVVFIVILAARTVMHMR